MTTERSDCYCAICGGPFRGIRFSNLPVDKYPDAGHDEDDASDDSEDASDSESSFNAIVKGAYDGDILSKADIEWTKHLVVLGLNTQAKGPRKAFISGRGSLYEGRTVFVDDSDDPFMDGTQIAEMTCYRDEHDHEPLFPCHVTCAGMLTDFLKSNSDQTELDKDALYYACLHLVRHRTRRLDVEYHEPGAPETGPEDTPTWRSVGGYEYLVVSPSPAPEDLTSSQLKLDLQYGLKLKVADVKDLSPGVVRDPFAHLPSEILQEVAFFLDDRSLQNLDVASWHVHARFHDDEGFWKQRLKHVVSWFFELGNVMASLERVCSFDARATFFWALHQSSPREGLTGHFMAIANRRRIMAVQAQISREYQRQLSRPSHDELVDPNVRDQASCRRMPFVSAPVCAMRSVSETFWIRNGGDFSGEKTIQTFWAGDGSLVGISIAPPGERRVFGREDSERGDRNESAPIPGGVWMTGVDLHLPHLKGPSKDEGLRASPQGITASYQFHRIYLDSGEHLTFGNTSTECQRHYEVRPGHCIVGVQGEVGYPGSEPDRISSSTSSSDLKTDHRILRFGILEVSADVLNRQVASRSVTPSELDLERYLWTTQSVNQGPHPIWAWPGLSAHDLGGQSQQWASQYCHEDLLPMEAFMWAHTPSELRSLTKLVATIRHEKPKKKAKGKRARKSPAGILSIRAEYTEKSGLRPRQMRALEASNEGADVLEEEFEIDGPGGEYFTEVFVPMAGDDHPALCFTTNRKRTVSFADSDDVAWVAVTGLRGRVLAGIVASFGWVVGSAGEGREHQQTIMGYVGGLTLPRKGAKTEGSGR